MTEKEQETRRAVSKIGYFQGHYQLGLIDYLENELPEKFRFNVRSEIEPDFLRKIDELEAMKFRESITIDEVNSLLFDILVNYRREFYELRDRLIELSDFPDD